MSLQVMVNGLPGKMAIEVSQAILRRGWELIPYSLTGSGSPSHFEFDSHKSELLSPENRNARGAELKARWPHLIAVDYTHPSAVNPNAEFYTQFQIPFVMGTTGGDREALHRIVTEASLPALIAPNMAKPIVALQSMLAKMAAEYPGVFSGSQFKVTESHQKTKADTSGTAKAIVSSFNAMGIPYTEEDIELIREESAQIEFGVPQEFLGGHAFHTYQVISPDGSCELQFRHNVCGRTIYAEGTADAVAFLAARIASGAPAKIYNMIDVLSEGQMG